MKWMTESKLEMQTFAELRDVALWPGGQEIGSKREICPRDVEDFLKNFTIYYFHGELTVAPYKNNARFALQSQFSLHEFDWLSACECGVVSHKFHYEQLITERN